MAKTTSKRIKTPQTYDEFKAYAWSSFQTLQADHADRIGVPTYLYKVGEDVLYGNLPDCRVEEVLMDGKLIHISSHDRGETYGQPFDKQRRLPHFVWWMDLEAPAVMENTRFSVERGWMRASFTQTSLESLIGQYYRRGVIDSPDYQRGYVWTLEDKQRLIQSIMDRADIGKFLFLQYPFEVDYRLEIIDGKQRLSTIIAFYEGRFEFKGKTWHQFSRRDKHNFMDVVVQEAKMNAEHVKKSDVLWLFLSINAGGVPQTEEHIGHARKLYLEALTAEAKA